MCYNPNMATVFLSLGSNLGDRLENVKKALRLLESHVDVRRVSSVYETEPWGYKDQPWFLNAVCRAETDLAPAELLDFVKQVEQQLGRQPTVRYGPRRIDIDILFYEDQIIRRPDLQIPHPRIPERAFVLVPLTEIAPGLVHPVSRKTMRTLLRELEDADNVKQVSPVPRDGFSRHAG